MPQPFAQQQKIISHPEFLDPSFPICVDVFYHIVRKTNGTGGFDPNSLDIVTTTLNQAFNPHNFFINESGFDFIDNTGHYEYINNIP